MKHQELLYTNTRNLNANKQTAHIFNEDQAISQSPLRSQFSMPYTVPTKPRTIATAKGVSLLLPWLAPLAEELVVALAAVLLDRLAWEPVPSRVSTLCSARKFEDLPRVILAVGAFDDSDAAEVEPELLGD